MPPTAPFGPPGRGLTTLFADDVGGITFCRPTPTPRPGLIPKSSGHSTVHLGRRYAGGESERAAVDLFREFHLSVGDGRGEARDPLSNQELDHDDDGTDWIPRRRYAYTQEHSLP